MVMIDGRDGTAPDGLVGSWDVRRGSKPGRSGTARIERHTDALKIAWAFKDGDSGPREGYGFEVERGLIASRRVDGHGSGVVVYRRDAISGRRSASWYMKGFPKKGSGTLTGGPDRGWAGKYRVHYLVEDVERREFSFDLLIDQSGDVFRLEWWPPTGEESPRKAGEVPQFVGVGLCMGDDLVAGWCATAEGPYDDIQVIALASSAGGRVLQGECAGFSSTSPDREEMSKVAPG